MLNNTHCQEHSRLGPASGVCAVNADELLGTARNSAGSDLRRGDYPASSPPPHPPELASVWHPSDFTPWRESWGYLEKIVRLGHPPLPALGCFGGT